MGRFDLTLQRDRLAVVDQVFAYPQQPHRRKHGPTGYETPESYRDWLRDEFSYRCVFSLVREQWIGRPGNFDIDHYAPRTERLDLLCEYDNLLYLTHAINLIRNKKPLPNPCEIALGECLTIFSKGERAGEIDALNTHGERIILALKLDSKDATDFRRKTLATLRSLAITDETIFREMVGYPDELPDLRPPHRKNAGNTRLDGLEQSALVLQENGTLPEWC